MHLHFLYNQKVEAIEFRVNEENLVTNVPLMNLDLKDDLLISFIIRHGTIIIPSGQDCIKAGDTVMIVTTQKGLVDLSDILE